MPSKETYEDTVAGEDRDAEHHRSDLKKSVDDPLPLRKYRPTYKTINSNATIQPTGPAKDRRHRDKPIGVAIIGGVVSGGLEILDFDDGELFEPWRKSVESIACRLPVVSTPSFGWHVYYRCEEICGNQKIAMGPETSPGKREVLIETRGHGGYVVAPGSSMMCHKSGRPYIQELGPPIEETPVITRDERRTLWAAARVFDQRPPFAEEVNHRAKQIKRANRPSRPLPANGSVTPWDDFDARGDWTEILEPHGWTSFDGINWTRPGKSSGLSAKVNNAENGQEVLTVFSSNAGPLSPTGVSQSIGKSDAYTRLFHGGNHSESARALRQQGFGGRNGNYR